MKGLGGTGKVFISLHGPPLSSVKWAAFLCRWTQTSAIALTAAKGQSERPSYREQFDDEMLTWDPICAMW